MPFELNDAVIRDWPHVRVVRHAAKDGQDCRYEKTFKPAYWKEDAAYWMQRENDFLLGFVLGKVPHVVELARLERSGGSTTVIATADAGVTVEDWLRLKPRYAGDLACKHPFQHAGMFLALLRACLQALAAIHRRGIVHCDIKPDNICLPCEPWPCQPGRPVGVAFERIRLIDFAFAVTPERPLTRPLPILPEAAYQSSLLKAALAQDRARQRGGPFAAQALDWRVDLFSLGYFAGRILEDGLIQPKGKAGKAALDGVHRLVETLQACERERRLWPFSNKPPHTGLIADIDGWLARLTDLDAYRRFDPHPGAAATQPTPVAAPTPLAETATPLAVEAPKPVARPQAPPRAERKATAVQPAPPPPTAQPVVEEQASPQDWVLVFPSDRVVGSLEVGGSKIPAQGVVKLSTVASIAFHLEKQESDLSFFSRLPAKLPLHKLNLRECAQITDESLALLTISLRQLQEIDLGRCKQITDAGLAHLANLQQLQKLDLAFCEQITDADCAQLASLRQLQNLNLAYCAQITDAGLARLVSLQNLQYISLLGCGQITDLGLACLTKLPQLQYLCLWHCKEITDKGLSHLASLPHLCMLDLRECKKITGKGLAHLANLHQLEYLYLTYCDQLTDEDLAVLANLPQLWKLDLRGCKQITDRGLAYLAKLPKLWSLDLRGCDKITAQGLALLSHVKNIYR